MKNLIGMELGKAEKIIENQGRTCIIKEYNSERQAGEDLRVLRAKQLDAHTVELTAGGFKTELDA